MQQRPQPFLQPPDLFDFEEPGEPLVWSCLRTRARAEKKLARWLHARGKGCFLPTYEHETTSHRKKRTSVLPLIPGYLFARGRQEKKDFQATGLVASVLQPGTAIETARLHHELWSLWKSLLSGSRLELVEPLRPGDAVRITSGALAGMQGCFQQWGETGLLIIEVELIGVAVSVEVPENSVLVPV